MTLIRVVLFVMFILSTQRPEANLLMLVQVKPLGVSLERTSLIK